jgi:putative restriction endonuclease
MDSRDDRVRTAAFQFLSEQRQLLGEVLPRAVLVDGFYFAGERVPLVGPQGIFKPRLCELPLSITTVPSNPYLDSDGPDGLIAYRYRGADVQHHENVGLRTAMLRQTPLVYFRGLEPSRYAAVYPVRIVGDSPETLTFTVAAEASAIGLAPEDDSELTRRYATREVKQRLHQQLFRERVLTAYDRQCSLCRLRHVLLLDAAHIRADAHELGEPVVSNGVAMCKIHHAAFDASIVGIRPDYVIEVRSDVLHEIDGPMLQHGLQEMHGRGLYVPRRSDQKPDKSALEERYERFRAAA